MKINSKKYDLSFMKIQNLKITNFRGIRELDLDFSDRDLVVLVGVNGVGKSSILDISRILLSYLAEWLNDWQYYSEILSLSTPNVDKPLSLIEKSLYEGQLAAYQMTKGLETLEKPDDKIQKSFDSNFLLPINLHYIDNRSKNLIARISIEIILGNFKEKIKWGIQTKKSQNSNILSAKKALHEINKFTKNKDVLNLDDINLPILVYYSVNRAIPNSLLDSPEDSECFLSQVYHQALTGTNVGFKHFFQWFKILEDIENEEIRDNPEHRDKKLEAVRSAIYDLVPGFSNLRVRRSPLRMTVNKNNEELEINQLSDGEKCLIAMVGDIARRLAIANSNLANPLEGTGVVLIDEIELHLHPQWQKDVIPSLRRTFPNCQFIVTTHSPQVVSQVKPENVYILEKQADNIVVSHPELSYGREIGQIVEDVMGGVARPPEVRDELMQLFQLIEEGNLDAARQLHEQISDKIGADDPQLIKASASIRRREILNR
ncbi:AAA family ATPase [Geitlerinema sp. CS-897]|nr:AAA family ATPase [Geitlerinema sp. CS-897]